MNLFTIDTSGKQGTLGLARQTEAGIEVLAAESMAGGQFSSELIPKLAAMLESCGLRKRDLDAVGVVAGPGSFTGLRVGLAAAKGLAETLGLTLVALSSLEGIAASSGREGEVLATMDAGRSEVFAARCRLHPQLEVSMDGEWLLKPEDLAARARELQLPVVTADPKIAEQLLSQSIPAEIVHAPGTATWAGLAFAQMSRGATVRPDDLDANYVRRSDAELFPTLRR